jgi:2-polyprenyl-3-methyl-5-hydroxy-6-metoxy-1,4-benzoquinol methylase
MPTTTKRTELVRAYFDNVDSYLHNNRRVQVRATIVRWLLGPISGKRILDVGCGDGHISVQFLQDGNLVTMMDVSAAMLQRARDTTPAEYCDQVTYINSDIASFLVSTRFDVVLCIGLLAHVESVENTIRTLADLTATGGLCVLQITDSEQALTKFHNVCSTARRFVFRSGDHYFNNTPATKIRQLCLECGLNQVGERRHCLLPPGLDRVPNRLFQAYELFVARTVLARFGTDAILLFQKS